MSAPRPVSVRGGSTGIEVHVAELSRLARLFAAAAREVIEQSADLHRALIHPAVLASAPLDPAGAGEFEVQLLFALDGPGGLTRSAGRCAVLDVELRAAVLAYVGADQLREEVVPAAAGLVELARSVPDGYPHGGIRAWAAAHPETVDLVVDVGLLGAGGPIRGLLARWPDGRAEVSYRGADVDPAATTPPRTVRDLMAGLVRRDRAPTGGEVDVRFVTSTDAAGRQRRRVIVDIPGTKSWSPWPQVADPTSLSTNGRAIVGAATTYGAGVLGALRQAGVGPTEPVLLMGHSEGGMVAVGVAREAARSGEFHITHIVTAGAPIARLAPPPAVSVLAIENDGDVVPHFDGADNPERAAETTVRVHRNTGDVETNHDLERSYVPAAGDVDASTDAGVRSYLSGLRPFLEGTTVRTEVFHIERR